MSVPSSPRPTDDLESLYRSQIRSMMTEESQKRIDRHVDPMEDKRLMDLDIIELVSSSSEDTVPALMARLGVVRAALIGHGGALVLHSHLITKDHAGAESLSLVIDLD